jgi:Flp pilus assembly protein TadB
MTWDPSGWMWFGIDVILVAALAIGLAYGIMAWRSRRQDPTMESVRDAATHRAYENNKANQP